MSSRDTQSIQYSFSGKKVLVTGGGEGLGHSIISRLYQDGAQVFTLEQNPALVDQLRKDFPLIRAEVADVSRWEETQKIINAFGPMDHLVNNAGIVKFEGFLSVTEDQVDRVMAVNLKSVFAVSQAVAKGMIAAGIKGSIVSVTSIASHISTETASVYGAAKSGLFMLSKCMARELGPYGIRSNTVSPISMDTPMYRRGAGELPDLNDVRNFMSRQPLQGRSPILTPEEVTQAILFLLSPLSSMATGVDILLDGGVAAC